VCTPIEGFARTTALNCWLCHLSSVSTGCGFVLHSTNYNYGRQETSNASVCCDGGPLTADEASVLTGHGASPFGRGVHTDGPPEAAHTETMSLLTDRMREFPSDRSRTSSAVFTRCVLFASLYHHGITHVLSLPCLKTEFGCFDAHMSSFQK